MARLGGIDSQFFDANGDPLSGGKLNFYDSGTTNRKTTYSNAALSTANANPVVLDAAGVPPNIFFTGTAKIVLTDADDVVIRTLDPVEACCAEGGGGGGLYTIDTTVRTANFTAVAGNYYIAAPLSESSITMTLPASPSAGDIVGVRHYDQTTQVFINENGSKIEYQSSGVDFVLNSTQNSIAQGYVVLVYVDSDYGWMVVQGEIGIVSE